MRTRIWLVLIGLAPACALAVVAFARDPSGAAAAAAVALVAVPALPLWWRWHDGALRLSAGLIGAAVSALCLWAALSGGLLLLPTGLLLLAAAIVPPGWSLQRALAAVLVATAGVVGVPFLLYGLYTWLS